MEHKTSELALYLKRVLKDRGLSIRAFATYAGIAHTTLRRALLGGIPEHETLKKIAQYLRIPAEDLYSMAGLLNPEDRKWRNEATRVIEDLYSKLSESDQREIIDIIHMKLDRQSKD